MVQDSKTAAELRPKHLIPVVLHTLDILDCFADEKATLSVAEVVAATRIPRASAFRIVRTLAHRGLLAQVPGSKKYRRVARSQKLAIGYCGMSIREPFAAAVLEGLEHAARGAGLRLHLTEPPDDLPHGLQEVEALLGEGIRMMLHFHLAEDFAPLISRRLRDAGIPQIALDIPYPDAIFFGIDNFRAGFDGGEELGRHARLKWRAKRQRPAADAVLLLDQTSAGQMVAERMTGTWYGIQQVLGPMDASLLTRVDCGGQREQASRITEAFLRDRPRDQRILIGSINDSSGLGALDAVRRLKREAHVAIVGQDCIDEALTELANPNSALIGSVAHFPETYGAQVIALALRILQGEQVPPMNYTRHQLVTRENYHEHAPVTDAKSSAPDVDSDE